MPARLPRSNPDLKPPRALLSAVRAADIAEVAALLDGDPDLVWADGLFLQACRVPGYNGHGGSIPESDAKDGLRARVVDAFITHGAPPSMRNKRNVTPLHMAARFNLPAVARTLIEAGAEVDAKDTSKETPLFRAVNLGYPRVVELLLDHGADPNWSNRRGETPLHRAALRGKVELVPLLLEHGADVTLRARDGRTALECARNPTIKKLLE